MTVAGPNDESRCAACERIGRALRGEPDHLFIRDLGRTLVFLHQHQPYAGWCVLFLKEHREHLADLPVESQAAIFEDVAGVAAAVHRAFAPQRINYECLGNQMHHVHWHVIPRYSRPLDPDPGQTVWVRPTSELNAPLERERAAELVDRLRNEITPLARR